VKPDFSARDQASAAKAAERYYAAAQNSIGLRYVYGRGLAQSLSEAKPWFERAAAQGHSDATRYLGLMYERGDGVPADAVEAVRLYRVAARKGHPGTQVRLAVMYATGSGLTRDDGRIHVVHGRDGKWCTG
jgi:TPR repeat protein